MARTLSLTMVLLLAAGIAHADIPSLPAKRTVRFAQASSADRLRARLQEQIDRFTAIPLQFVRFIYDASADFDVTDLHCEPAVNSSLKLVGRVKDPAGAPRLVRSGPVTEKDNFKRPFDELVERTLFDDERGVYRPLRIESCSMAGPRAVRLSVTP